MIFTLERCLYFTIVVIDNGPKNKGVKEVNLVDLLYREDAQRKWKALGHVHLGYVQTSHVNKAEEFCFLRRMNTLNETLMKCPK